VSIEVIHQIMDTCNIPNVKQKYFWELCVLDKSHQLPFFDSSKVYTHPLQLVFMDI